MAEHLHNPSAEPVHAHEHRDLSITAVIWFAISMIIGAIITHGIVYGYYTLLMAHAPGGPPASPYSPPRELPPYPRLQVNPQLELRDYKAKEEQLLNNYSWVDKSKGIARIPVEEAIQMIAQHGLPAAPAPAATITQMQNPNSSTNPMTSGYAKDSGTIPMEPRTIPYPSDVNPGVPSTQAVFNAPPLMQVTGPNAAAPVNRAQPLGAGSTQMPANPPRNEQPPAGPSGR